MPSNAQLIEQLNVGVGSFADRISEISTAAMVSDQESQMRHLGFLQGVLDMPNIVMDQSEDLGFGLGAVSRHDERAAITGIKVDRLGFEYVDMDFSMTVGSHTANESEKGSTVKTDTEIEASGKLLFWKARVKQNISAEVRHNNKNTRTTDMSAEVNIQAKLTRQSAPEGLSKMMDVANEFSRKVNDLRMKIATAKVDRLLQQIDDGQVDLEQLQEAGDQAVKSEVEA